MGRLLGGGSRREGKKGWGVENAARACLGRWLHAHSAGGGVAAPGGPLAAPHEAAKSARIEVLSAVSRYPRGGATPRPRPLRSSLHDARDGRTDHAADRQLKRRTTE